MSERNERRLENSRSKLPSQEKLQPVECKTTCFAEPKMVALETFAVSQSDAGFDLYAVYSQTGVIRVRSDRVDLLNRQVTLRGHCTTHVLRDRQLAANHPSTVLSRERKNKTIKKLHSCRLKPLPRFRPTRDGFFALEFAALFLRAPRGRLLIRPKHSTAVLPVC